MNPTPLRQRSLADDLVAALARPRYGVVLFVLAAGVVALALGVDTSVDLKSFHYYNAWAFLHKRATVDIAPAGLDTFRNPLPDLPFFAIVSLGLPAWVATFLLGIPAGVGGYFFFRVARRVVVDLRLARRGLALLAIGLVAATGTATASQVGAAGGQWLVAALVLPAVFLIVREGQREAGPSRSMLGLAGLLLGVATGLQPTAGAFALAAIVATVAGLRGRPHVARGVVALIAYGLLGGLVASGLWAALLAGRYGNPFFPYFNAVFRSEYWTPTDLPWHEFAMPTPGAWLGWPFGLAERNQLMTSVPMREPRLAALALVAIALAVAAVVERLRQDPAGAAPPGVARSLRIVALFTATGYVAWLGLSGDYRATIPVELLASLLLVVGLAELLRGARHRDVLLAIACLAIVAATSLPNWGRARAGGGPYLDVQAPPLAPNALVITATGPVGYVVPFLPEGTRVLRLVGSYRDRPFPHRLQQAMHDAVAAHAGPLYLLRRAEAVDPNEDAMLAGYRLARADAGCAPVRSNLDELALELCPLERAATNGEAAGRGAVGGAGERNDAVGGVGQ